MEARLALQFMDTRLTPLSPETDPRLLIHQYEQSYGHQGKKMDYVALHAESGTAIAEYWGNRDYQQDATSISTFIYPNISHTAKLLAKPLLTSTIELMQDCVTHLKIGESGSTLSCSLISDQFIQTANVGDSFTFLCVFDAQGQIVQFEQINSKLHNTDNEEEYDRIKRAGIAVRYGQRLGNRHNAAAPALALLRAIGDNQFVQYGLSHQPDIYVTELLIPHNGRAFLITACDGLLEGNKFTLAEMRELIQKNYQLSCEALANLLAQTALQKGSLDNVSVIVTPLQPNKNTVVVAAVFDGHGTDKVAVTLQQLFPIVLEIKLNLGLLNEFKKSELFNKPELQRAFIRLDELCMFAFKQIPNLINTYINHNEIKNVLTRLDNFPEYVRLLKSCFARLNYFLNVIVTCDRQTRTNPDQVFNHLNLAITFLSMFEAHQLFTSFTKQYCATIYEITLDYPLPMLQKFFNYQSSLTIDNITQISATFWRECNEMEILYKIAGIMLGIRKKYAVDTPASLGDEFRYLLTIDNQKKQAIKRIEDIVRSAFQAYPAKIFSIDEFSTVLQTERRQLKTDNHLKSFWSFFKTNERLYDCVSAAIVALHALGYKPAVSQCQI